LTLCGDLGNDLDRANVVLVALREQRDALPEDPYLSFAEDADAHEKIDSAVLPESGEAVDSVLSTCAGRDLVGLFASGEVFGGFANSIGKRCWFSTRSFNLDVSLHLQGDRAVKTAYAGRDWRPESLQRRMHAAGEQLELLHHAPIELAPGEYDAYLTPVALAELFGLLGWGGFSLRAHRTKTAPLLRMTAEGATLAPILSLKENTRDGYGADFQAQGFRRPGSVPLIEAGSFRECLVSPRSAVEFGVPTNGAGLEEMPESIDMAPGRLASEGVLDALGRGLYLSNLHYLNYSDRKHCRTTGMTRFACFWVEHGRLQAPIRPIRFDETVYRLLGENLVDLSEERETLLDPQTYGGRSTSSARLPGALVRSMRFTL
jgi:predicted Zn-dependent protease